MTRRFRIAPPSVLAAALVPLLALAACSPAPEEGFEEEQVRILVNDRVLPLESCGANAFGMCSLSAFIESLSFARSGGRWDQCFGKDNGNLVTTELIANMRDGSEL